MEIRDFEKDLITSNNPILLKNWDTIFKKVFGECEIQWKENCSVSQLSFGADVLIVTKRGRKYSIDVKTRRSDYLNNPFWLMEIAHHIYTDETRKEKVSTEAGWLYKSTADIIFFGTTAEDKTTIKEVCAFSLTPFKDEEFKSEISKFDNGWASSKRGNRFWLTLNKKITLDFIRENAHKFWYIKE